MTTPALDGLPRGPAALAGIVQGLLIHEHLASTYGVTLRPEQHAGAHVRSVEGILSDVAARDPAPLASPRAPAERQVGVCSHFALMHATMLRTQGIEARPRCGFGAYFEKGRYVDHWVTEYWNTAETRWVLVDSQIDEHQRRLFGVDFDLLDVPRDRFLVAGHAWQLCRSGKLDPRQFGVMDMWGSWFIASNVIRDIASLNGRTLLPWDVWGAMTEHDAEIDHELIDRLAGLSCAPDADPTALHTAYADPRVTVPASVFNAVLKRVDEV